MSTTPPQIKCVEHVDDIPVLWAHLRRQKVAQILDQHFQQHHRWQGRLTFGEVACVWLVFITSQGDHRLNRLQPWAQQHLHVLEACLGKPVRPLDFHDDRLADILDRLAHADTWQAIDTDLNRHSIRVYNLEPSLFRIDTTTASSYAEGLCAHGLLQFGHSKDNPDLPQLKIAVAAMDPLGLPVAVAVVPGNCADDPLYVPQIRKTQQSCGQGGNTFVMDVKGAALATRAYLASTRDYYLCPLSETQVSAKQRHALLQPVWESKQPLQRVYRPGADDETQELVAEGFAVAVVLKAKVGDKVTQWTERRWLVRSLAFAQGQEKVLDRRLQAAEQQLAQLGQRKQGKKRLSAAGMATAAAQIVKEQRVEGLLNWQVHTSVQQRQVRRYRDRPARLERVKDHRVVVTRCHDKIAAVKRELGWRVYATNQRTMTLAVVVWGYRGQYRIENDWKRLKGCPLSLSPLYLQEQRRMHGLVLLLSLALRLLTLVEYTVRRKLHKTGATLKGLYPGQPGRQTRRPSAELLLEAFQGISLTICEVNGQCYPHITPLTPLQKKLLRLWGFPPGLYHQLCVHLSQPPPQS
jgi:transposase